MRIHMCYAKERTMKMPSACFWRSFFTQYFAWVHKQRKHCQMQQIPSKIQCSGRFYRFFTFNNSSWPILLCLSLTMYMQWLFFTARCAHYLKELLHSYVLLLGVVEFMLYLLVTPRSYENLNFIFALRTTAHAFHYLWKGFMMCNPNQNHLAALVVSN